MRAGPPSQAGEGAVQAGPPSQAGEGAIQSSTFDRPEGVELPGPLSRLRERAGVRAVANARNLRTHSTDAESLLWRHLRDRRLEGFKFRRQFAIGHFIADFACLETDLIVELDGGQHFEPEALAADQRRTAVLVKHGFTVLRFDNRQMLLETEAVLFAIRDWLFCQRPHPNPLPQAGEGASQTNPLPQAGERVIQNGIPT
jgi:very-short-patch-repair endonuclease